MRIVIVGAGEVGFHIAQRLATEAKDVVVIDRDEAVLARIAELLDVQTVQGSGSSPRILEQAGIKEAQILLAVTDSDEINLIACTFADILSHGLTKLARIRNPDYLSYQEILTRDMHIDRVINPEDEVIRSIEGLMLAPGALEISDFSEGRLKLVGVQIEEHSDLSGTPLIRFRETMGFSRIIVAAIVRDEELIIPTGLDTIQPGDIIYFVCEKRDVLDILKRFGHARLELRNVLVIGGGNIGLKFARSLERMGIHAKLIEKDRDRCEFLAEQLNTTVVLHGDGTDQELLLEENIQDMDVVVALTSDEEKNILCTLLAKKLGAGMVINRINKFAYLPLVRAIGIQHTVSPRMSAVNSILQHIRRGNIITAISIKDQAEALEALAEEGSAVVGRPIKELGLPKGSLVLSIIRGQEVIIPTGDSVIQPGDRFVLFSTRKNIPRLESSLMMKLENI
ncbi:MAG: Trk system potassium transporter TrkA [Desulfohalobiaceae bacterium]